MESNRQRITDWLNQHPGQHRPTEVARELGLTTQQTAWAMADLTKRGKIQRTRLTTTSSTYSSLEGSLTPG